MIETSIQRLDFLGKVIPPLLEQIPEQTFLHKPSPDVWSKKQILGHLIDSAANNHHRFVRAQFEHIPQINYDNHVWNSGNHYQEIPVTQLISFWQAYNTHLVEVIRRIPLLKLTRLVDTGKTGEKKHVTLGFLIEDYVAHMEHHLKQLVDYKL